MSVIKFNRNFSELFNWDSDEDPTTEQEYQSAVRNWTEVVMDIVDTLLWQPETDYVENNIVKTPSLPLHYVLVCTTGGTSGTTEPSYDNVQIGDSVTDGTVTWTVAKLTVSSDVPQVTDRAMVDASNIGVNAEEDNSEAWGSAIGGGAVAEDDGKLVTGDTVYAVTSELASDIADNTANISQNATDIDIADKRISNIEKLLQGNLYDYQTDSTSAYTKTVPVGALPYAGIERIGGKTLVWNQLNDNANNSKTSGNITIIKDADNGIWTVNGTEESIITYNISSAINYIAGHKYLLMGCPSGGSGTTFSLMATNLGATDNGDGTIVTCSTSNNGYVRIIIRGGYVASNLVFRPLLFDLTLMFGAGNEPSTVSEFTEMFPASYYPYNAGTLLSAGVTEVVSRKQNLVNPTMLTNGSYYANGSVAPSTTRVSIGSNYIEVEPSETYAIGSDGTNILVHEIYQFDSNKTIVGSASTIGQAFTNLTVGNTTHYIRYSYRNSSNTTILPSDVTNPYFLKGANANITIATYPIPAEIRSLEGYGWSAGSVFNYIDYERKVFVKRVGRVLVDGINVAATNVGVSGATGNYYSSIPISNGKPGSHNVISDELRNDGSSVAYLGNIYIGLNGALICVFYDQTMATKEAVNTFLSNNNVEVYYELATPVEIDISEYLTDDNLISVESGGTLTFPNSNGDDYRIPVPSAETYMVDLQSALGE